MEAFLKFIMEFLVFIVLLIPVGLIYSHYFPRIMIVDKEFWIIYVWCIIVYQVIKISDNLVKKFTE